MVGVLAGVVFAVVAMLIMWTAGHGEYRGVHARPVPVGKHRSQLTSVLTEDTVALWELTHRHRPNTTSMRWAARLARNFSCYAGS